MSGGHIKADLFIQAFVFHLGLGERMLLAGQIPEGILKAVVAALTEVWEVKRRERQSRSEKVFLHNLFLSAVKHLSICSKWDYGKLENRM